MNASVSKEVAAGRVAVITGGASGIGLGVATHLAEAGHPVLSDNMYGRGIDPAFPRLALHARELGFVHPRTGTRVSFTADVPRMFREWQL